MSEDRSWMYKGRRQRGEVTAEWIAKTMDFVDRAFGRDTGGDDVLCPCNYCNNTRPQAKGMMIKHLTKYGFRPDYAVWVYHGEADLTHDDVMGQRSEDEDTEADVDRMDDMIDDVRDAYMSVVEEEPEPTARHFYEMLSAANQPLHSHTEISQLDAITRLLAVKSQFSITISGFDAFLNVVCSFLPPGHKLPHNLYEAKKFLSALTMPYEKIDACPNNCMLFRKENANKTHCDKCRESRYVEVENSNGEKRQLTVARKILRYLPIIPRLQRLYMSEPQAKQMTWHKYGHRYQPNKMVHPSDAEAWKQFDRDFPDFAADARNVKVAIATDGFNPFGMGASSYSCWPVFVIPLNLPPGILMQQHTIFLSLVIPGREYPGKNISVFMQPLVDDLMHAWENGVLTYDRATKQNFNMRVSFLFSNHDLPAYGIFCGWCTHGKMPCPICKAALKGLWLKFGGKFSFFDSHRQFLPIDHNFRSDANSFLANTVVTTEPPPQLTCEEVLAEFDGLVPLADGDGFENYGEDHNWTHITSLRSLPYFHKLLLPHNIDVMHNEKNVAEAIFNTCFDIPDKTKDNVKARLDQEALCNRPNLNLVKKASGKWEKPRARFCLTRPQKKEVLEWIQTLKFPDGHAANMRRGVNMKTMRINGLKSHCYHIMMERLFPVMFRGYLPADIWGALAELSFFYRKLCAKAIDPAEMADMERQVHVLICKLETIFPPGFFNPMEHLIMHLPYEARMGGPVQNRWMYPIERGQKVLKGKVKNRARVEASIAESYILDEISHFTSIYFVDQVHTVHNPVPRYNASVELNDCQLSLFSIKGDSSSRAIPRHLSEEEWAAAMLYVLTNLREVDDYIEKFIREEWKKRRGPNRAQKERLLRNGARQGRPNFVSWFYQKSLTDMTMSDDLIQVAKGCHTRVKAYNTFDINGYRFRTDKHEKERPNAATINSGLVTIGQGENNDTIEYYGYIKEIIELSFEGTRPLTLVLFNCHWFNPSEVRYTPKYGLVEVAYASVLPVYEPFVVAHKATQVYYIPHPCKSVKDLADRWVVYKVQPIGKLQVPADQDYDFDFLPNNNTVQFFQEDGLLGSFVVDLLQEEEGDAEVGANLGDAEDIVNEKDLELLNGLDVPQEVEQTNNDSSHEDEDEEPLDDYF